MGVLTAIFNTLIILTSLFMIFLILIQRGKGGGLAGAFGGVGGSSAFGTKAGDTFTRVTVITAAVWMLMAMLLVVLTSRRPTSGWGGETPSSLTKELGSSSSRGKANTPASTAGSGSEAAPASAPAAPSPASGSATPAESPASSGSVPAIPKSATFPEAPAGAPKTP